MKFWSELLLAGLALGCLSVAAHARPGMGISISRLEGVRGDAIDLRSFEGRVGTLEISYQGAQIPNELKTPVPTRARCMITNNSLERHVQLETDLALSDSVFSYQDTPSMGLYPLQKDLKVTAGAQKFWSLHDIVAPPAFHCANGPIPRNGYFSHALIIKADSVAFEVRYECRSGNLPQIQTYFTTCVF